MPRQPGVYATFNTSEGTIVCRLFESEAPITVKNFTELAEGTSHGFMMEPFFTG